MASVGTIVVATQHHGGSTDSLQGADGAPACESRASRAQCRLGQRCTRRQAAHLAALIIASVALVACASSKRTELNSNS